MFNVPRTLTREECLRAFKDGILEKDGKEFEVKKNKLTTESYLTHGSLKYTGKY